LGRSNPLAPPILVDTQGQTVVGQVRFGSAFEGPPGCVHGGFVAAAFDEVLGLTQSLSGQVGMTGRLTVHYRRPTPLHTDLRFEGRLDGVSGRKVLTSAKLYAGAELTADATGRRVLVGPAEATALGNIAIQILATGGATSLKEVRAIVDRSFPTEIFEPIETEKWDQNAERFEHYCESIYA